MSPKALEAAWDRVMKAKAELDDALENYALAQAGQETPGQQAKSLINAYVRAWAKKYPGQTYLPSWPRDTKNFKTLLKTFSAEQIREKLAAYLRSDDTFFVNAKHDLSAFPSAINKLTTAAPLLMDSVGPVDCQHVPRCKDDQAHTQRKLRDRLS